MKPFNPWIYSKSTFHTEVWIEVYIRWVSPVLKYIKKMKNPHLMNRKLVGASMLTVAVELYEQFLQLINVRSDHGVHLKI